MIPAAARQNIQVVKSISKIAEAFRQIQIGNKELRIRDLDTERIRQSIMVKGAELGNCLLSTAILIHNMEQANPMQDMDRIFQEDDQAGVQRRGTLEVLTKALKFLYASDAHEQPTQEFRAEVQRILNNHVVLQ